METNTMLWLGWSVVMMAMLWMMKNEKIKVIFGEIRKLLQVASIGKIAEVIITYYKSKGKTNPEP
ncbi:hypothetical protein [Flavobacterium psychrophilum]|uniref:hypothetical protein n=1 Tax=Flavobacterium psychrophilum TaxID=96345 RepID=UPI000B7C355F|nr:hypothetical protein [Flavobacterium psychrophilum]MCB6232046.1 hypothetical protein [Flavobacterium psychrophilum]SNB07132.1 hypothetical protein JIP1600_1470003 [Flavobacterium psychrophilum]